MVSDRPSLMQEKGHRLGARCAIRTAGDLCRESLFVEDDRRNREVFDLFESNPDLLNLPVVGKGDVVGLINRDSFMRSMARRFHWELYADRRCRKMMDEAPLTVAAETPIDELADLLLRTGNSYSLSDGFVIKRGAKLLGTGLTSHVLEALLLNQRLLSEELLTANERLLELTISDPLTGLHNRRHFNVVLANELKRAQRDRQTVGLIMLDIDQFKKLNDKLGHQAGDEALKQVATALGGCLQRPSDYCFRLGGEEFSVLTTDASCETLAALSEILRSQIEALQLRNPDAPLGIVTISAGTALSVPGGDSPDEIYARADRALYRAKTSGRNRVVRSGSDSADT